MKSNKTTPEERIKRTTDVALKALSEVEEGMFDGESIKVLREYVEYHAKKSLKAIGFAERNGCSLPEKNNWRTFDLEKRMNSIYSQLVEIESMSIRAEKEMKSAELSTSDMMHEFELLGLSDDELTANAKELVELRKYRREAKEFIEAAAPVVRLLTKERAVADRIRVVSGNVRDIKNQQKHRCYEPRKRSHMAPKFEALKQANS